MGALEEKQGVSHFLVDLTPRKMQAATMSPRFIESPRLRVPGQLKASLHNLKHTLGQAERLTGFVDRLRLLVFGALLVMALSGVTLWMVWDRQFLVGELVEMKELQMNLEGNRQLALCRDVEQWKGLVDDYRLQNHQLQLKLENQRLQLREGLISSQANPVHREEGGDRSDREFQGLRVKPSTCFDSDTYKNKYAPGQNWSHEEAWEVFFNQGYQSGHAFTFHC